MKIKLSQQRCYNIQYTAYLHSKLLGGGIESMAITEAFGGEEMSLIYHIRLDDCNSWLRWFKNSQHYFSPQSSAQGKPSCRTHSVVSNEPFRNGCFRVDWRNNTVHVI